MYDGPGNLPVLAETRSFTAARVIEADGANGTVLVRTEGDPSARERCATLAVSPPPADGDRVLVAGDPGTELFVIGVLTRTRPSPRLETVSGAWAEAGDGGDLRVYSKRGELLFEYDPAGEKARVTVERGDLELVSREGDITLRAAGDLRLGGETVDVAGRRSACMGVVGDAGSEVPTALALTKGRARLASPSVGVRADRARFDVRGATWDGEFLTARIRQAKLVGERLETVARTVIQKARDVFRTVRGLAQLKTRRRRVLVDESYHLSAERSRMRTKEEFQVDGDRILLG